MNKKHQMRLINPVVTRKACKPVFVSIIVLLVFAVFIIPYFVLATPIVFESNATGSTDTLIGGMTWRHTIACNDDRILIVGVAVDDGPTALVNYITYDGVNLSKVAHNSSSDGEVQVEMWNLTNPACGYSEEIIVSFTNPTAAEAAGVSSVYYGVETVNLSSVKMFEDPSGTASSSSVTVLAESDHIVVDVFGLDNEATFAVSGDNRILRSFSDHGDVLVATSSGSDIDGDVVMGWGGGFTDEVTQIGVALIPVTYGTLTINLTAPADDTTIQLNDTFYLNATVDCVGVAGSTCGTVYAYVKYNDTTAVPDTMVSSITNAEPFFVLEWDMSSAVDSKINSTALDDAPRDIFFRPDGIKMYEVGNGEDYPAKAKIYQSTLSDPWNISSATYDVNIYLQDGSSQGVFFKPDGTRMYEIGGDEGKIYQHACSDAWNISSCSYNQINISAHDTKDLFFKSDGTELYEIGLGDIIYQSTLSDPWNISSATYNQVNISTQDASSEGLFFKYDGTKLFEIGFEQDKIYQYTCSDAWNLSSCSYDNISASTRDTYPMNLFISPDGTKLYEVGYNERVLFQHSLEGFGNPQSQSLDQGEQWNVSWEINASEMGVYEFGVLFNSSSGSTNVLDSYTGNSTITTTSPGTLNVNLTKPTNSTVVGRGDLFFMNATVDCVGVAGTSCGTVYAYVRYNNTIATPDTLINVTEGVSPFYVFNTTWELSFATYDDINISAQDSEPTDLFFKPDGTRMYAIGTAYDIIFQFDCSDAWNLSSCSYNGVNIPAHHLFVTGLFFKPDGNRMYEIVDGHDKIYQYTCSDAWNISSCSYDQVNISTQDGNPSDMFFKPDGTKLYEVGVLSSQFYQYTCTDAWNLSSCSYDSISIATRDGLPLDLFFKPDGTKLYEVGNNKNIIHQWSCSDAWNLSSCFYNQINISTQATYPQGIFFKPEGDRLYECGVSNIYQYSFPSPETSQSQSLDQGESWNVTWILNVTATSTKSHLLDVFFNSSYGSSMVSDNNTGTAELLIDATPPVSAASATSPPGGASYTFGDWTSSNVTVTIVGYDSGLGFDTLVYPAYCLDTTNTCNPGTFISSGVQISTEGTSYIRYNATDYGGSVETVKSGTVRIDTTGPNVTVVSPANSSYGSTTSWFNITIADDNSGIDTAIYSLDGGITNFTMSNITASMFNATNGSMSQGVHTANFYVNDSLNNWNTSESVTFTIGTMPPNIIINSPTNSTYNSVISWFNITATDATSELDTAIYSLDGGVTNFTMSNITTSMFNATNSTMSQGSHTASFYVNNSMNNLNNSETVIFFIDSITPLISIASPVGGLNTTDTLVDINYTLSDTNIESCWYSNNTYAGNVTIACGDNITLITWAEGQHNVTIWSNDTANNVNSSSTTFIIDTTNPNATFIFPENNTYNATTSQNFTTNLTDNSGIQNATLYIYNETDEFSQTTVTYGGNVLTDTLGVVVVLVEGAYNWWVELWDWTGNTFSTENRTITIDTTIPLIFYDSSTYTNNTYQQTGDIFINITTTDTNNETVWFEWNSVNESFDNFDGDFYWENQTGLAEGAYLFYAWTNDSANNFNLTESRTIYIDLNDPTLNILSPTASAYNYNTTLELNYTISDTYLDSCWWNLDGATNLSLTCGTNETFNTTEAAHILYLYANDSSGRETMTNVSFAVSLAPPGITLDYPADDGWLNYATNIGFNYTPIDTSLGTCEFWINSTGTFSLNQTDTGPATGVTNTFNLTLPEGAYIWNIWCNDTANNDALGNPAGNNTVNVDITYPLLEYGIVTGSDGVNLSQSNVYINTTWTELHLKNITFVLLNDSGMVNSTAYTSSIYEINWTGLVDNNYSYYVNITDNAENMNSTGIRYITIDDTIPNAVLTFPENNTYNTTAAQNFTTNISDNLGVKNSTLYIYNETGEFNQTAFSFGGYVISDTVGVVVSVADGAYNWWYDAWDWAGNTYTAENQTLIIDSTTPLINYSIGVIANNTNTTLTSIFVNVTVTEINEESIVFTLFNSTDEYNVSILASGTRDINWTSLPDDTYHYNVSINDTTGNSNNTIDRYVLLDDTKPVITTLRPLAQNYGTNNSMSLNYSATDNLVGLDECWYYIQNSSGYLIKVTETLASCQNDTFNLPGTDIDYTLSLFAKDLLSNTQVSSVVFGIRTDSPVIVLTTVNDTHTKTTANNYFNFTVETDADNISACELWGNWTSAGWHKNQTIGSTAEATDINFTVVALSEGEYVWNVNCSDNFGYHGFALNNNSYIVDLTYPQINITNVTTEIGRQTFTFNTSLIELYSRVATCKYSIFDSTGAIDGLNDNVSFTCNQQKSATVSVYATYNLTTYVEDKAGNENSSTQKFTVSVSTPSGPSTGGGLAQKMLPVIIIGENVTWSMKTDTGGNFYDFFMSKGSGRTKRVYFTNLEGTEVTINVSCENIVGGLCSYVVFSNTSVVLPPTPQIEGYTEFTLQLPDVLADAIYDFNIVGIANIDKSIGKVSVRARVGEYGIFGWLVNKVIGKTKLNLSWINDKLSQFEVYNFFILALPFILLAPALYFFAFKNMKIKFPLSLLVVSTMSFILLFVVH